ncbi:unnamed protein product [Prorocentrum cordatum]|uniref:Uncharacterized protein n=1 Tax=Prorocentrum cordatum TaxID=2364126 RepID=A0ABN9XFT6_9DINO|nr:unnamed protein product [Polarella glacialis]
MVDEQAGYALLGAAARRGGAGRPGKELPAGGPPPLGGADAPGGLEEGAAGAAEGLPPLAPAARRNPAPWGPRWAALLAASACLAGAAAALGGRLLARRASAPSLAAGSEWKTALPSPVEKLLIVTSPSGQTQCEGTYAIQEHVPANGKPTWKKNGTGVPRTLYFSNTGTWMIDNNDALKAGFDCAIGYIHAPLDKSGDKMPWELEGWERYDNDAEKWIVDPAIAVKAVKGGAPAAASGPAAIAAAIAEERRDQ